MSTYFGCMAIIVLAIRYHQMHGNMISDQSMNINILWVHESIINETQDTGNRTDGNYMCVDDLTNSNVQDINAIRDDDPMGVSSDEVVHTDVGGDMKNIHDIKKLKMDCVSIKNLAVLGPKQSYFSWP